LHLHISLLVVIQTNPTRHNGMSHCLHLNVVCLPFPDEAFIFFSVHKTHKFARPDTFWNVWKNLGKTIPMGKDLFLPVSLRAVSVPFSWRTKVRLKVRCLFACAVEEGWYVRSCKMKQFTRHTFRTKCNTNFHHFLWRTADTTVLAVLIAYIHYSNKFGVIYCGLRTWNFNIFIAFSCFLVTEPSVRESEFVERRRTIRLSCHTTAVTSSCCIFLLRSFTIPRQLVS